MTLKSALSATGNGILTAATAIHNSSLNVRIAEIDEQIAQLQEERSRLVKDRI